MKLQPVKLAPVLIAVGVLVLVGLLRVVNFGPFERFELVSYDWRVRLAAKHPAPVATKLGCVLIGDDDIKALSDGSLGFQYGLYWPRHIYGRVYRELAVEGADAVGFDVLFDQARPDHNPVQVPTAKWPDVTNFLASLYPGVAPSTMHGSSGEETFVDSDDFLAWQLRRGGNAFLAAERSTLPISLLETNAAALGEITAVRDSDGVLRRVRAFRYYHRWHPVLQQAAEHGFDLDQTQVFPDKIVFHGDGVDPITVPIDAQTNFVLPQVGGTNSGAPAKARAFTDERVWHMGIVLAAHELKLDLAHAEVDFPRGRITLRGPGGVTRLIPVDAEGNMLINWELKFVDSRIKEEQIAGLLLADQIRTGFIPGTATNDWSGRVVIIGSDAQGNVLGDRGATPLEKDTFLVTTHWNVVNAILMNRFVTRASLGMELPLIVFMGVATALLTLRLRPLPAFISVVALALAYWLAAAWLYVGHRFWLPVFVPMFVVGVMEHVCLLIWRVKFEQEERRRVRSIFSRIVSPHVVNELLEAKKLELGGARKEVTVLFADVRGFTEFTDISQERATAYVVEHKLEGEAVEGFFNEHARETFNTVNTYLSLVADMVLKHEGVLDKYIGDCVMAFWGAPLPDPKQAVACVRAAVDAQRAIYELNSQRAEENRKRELENMARAAAGQTPLPMLAILMLGSGINTGMANAGLMGSATHQSNYTVFGREVNLASRLESLSGRGRVLISESTYKRLLRDDPELAATCAALPAAENLKGFRAAVKVFEVPWRPPGVPFDTEISAPITSGGTSTTTFVRRDTT